MIALLAGLAEAACPDPGLALDDAFAALSTLDFARVDTRIAEARAGFACGGPITRDALGRYWLVQGVAATLNGDAERAGAVLAAARRADPALRVDAWGDDVRAAWSAAGAPAGEGQLTTLRPLLGRDVAWIDGVPQAFPGAAPAGWHVVQISRYGRAWWSGEVFVPPGDEVALDVAQPPASEMPKRWTGGVMVAVGWDASVGDALSADVAGKTYTQSATQVGIPLEIGYEWDSRGAWIRPAAVVAPLVTGPYLYAGEEEPVRFPLAFGAGVAGGAWVGDGGRVGVLGQLAFPGQIRLRALASWPVAKALHIEGRLGVNAPAGQRVEPAFGAGLTWLP
jgi:hypothetical protein